MANGWGGRRLGAGAPKGNNNAVKHGEYCRPIVDVDVSSMFELRKLNIALCIDMSSLPSMYGATPDERREYIRLEGMSGQIIDKLIRLTRKESRDQLKQAEAHHREAKAELKQARARLCEAKARRKAAKIDTQTK